MSAAGPTRRAQSTKDDCGTPQYIFDYWDSIYHFDTDAAASAENARCAFFYDEQYDSLANPWDTGARYWLNPPYGNLLGWIQRCNAEAERGATIEALLPNNTDTKWFAEAVKSASRVSFLEGRISFIDPESGKPISGNPCGSIFITWVPPEYRVGPCVMEVIRIPKP